MSLLGYESGVLGFPCLLMPDLVGGASARFTNPRSAFPKLLASSLPVFSLTLQARARIAAELLAGTFNLKNVPTFGISADANATRLKVFPPQYVIEDRSNATTGQIPVWCFNWGIAPRINVRAEGVN